MNVNDYADNRQPRHWKLEAAICGSLLGLGIVGVALVVWPESVWWVIAQIQTRK